MPEIPARLAEKMQQEGEKTLAFFEAIALERWQTSIYTDGAHWNLGQILAHIVQTEDAMRRLIEGIVAGGAGVGAGVPEDFNLDAYNERKVSELRALSPAEQLALFADRRGATVAMVAGLTQDDLAKQGRHPFLGIAPVEEMLKLMYRHVQLHQRDIRRTLRFST